MDGATIVVWLIIKDHSVIIISGYDNETRPVEGVDNVIISKLRTSLVKIKGNIPVTVITTGAW